MLKLIRLNKLPGLYTFKGSLVPEGKTLVGSQDDAHHYLRFHGVSDTEIQLAEQFLAQCPNDNAVEFGLSLKVVVTSLENVDDVYAKIDGTRGAA